MICGYISLAIFIDLCVHFLYNFLYEFIRPIQGGLIWERL